MALFSWLKSLFKRPSAAGEMVRFFDVPSRRVISIPAAELRPGCIQAQVQGIDGVVWVMPEQLREGPLRHPPFDEEIRTYICDIQAAFSEHRDLTVDEWEDGFRRDANPEREIAMFSYAADVYRIFTQNENGEAKRAEIYKLLIACMTTAPASVWRVVKLQALDRERAEQIVRRFYGGEKVGEPPNT